MGTQAIFLPTGAGAEPAPISHPGSRPMAARRSIATFLIVVATLTGASALISLWAAVQVFNTESWVDTSERLIEDEEVRDGVSRYLVTELRDTAGLEGPAADLGSDALEARVADLLGSAPIVAVWTAANRSAHEQLLRQIDEPQSAESLGDAGLRLDLTELEASVAAELGLPALGLPAGSASFQVVPTDRVGQVRLLADVTRGAAPALLGVTVVLYALALLIGGGRRRIGFRIGVSLVLIALAGAVVRLSGPLLLDATIAPAADADQAVDSVWAIGTSLIVWLSSLCALSGAFLMIATWAWGRFGSASSQRDVSPRAS